jgi:hypothetical protein
MMLIAVTRKATSYASAPEAQRFKSAETNQRERRYPLDFERIKAHICNMNTSRLFVPMPDDLRRRLESHSERTGAPLAVLTRRALAKYLDTLDKQQERGERPPDGIQDDDFLE